MLTDQPGHQQGLRNVPITLLSSDRAGGKKTDETFVFVSGNFICMCVFLIFLLNVSISHHSSARAGGKKLIET